MMVFENLLDINEKVKSACLKVNRNQNEIKIIAVTKNVSIERTEEAMNAGIQHLGENRDEAFLHKWEAFKDKPTWHFIGTLQTRKVKMIIDKVDYIHSLDRASLAKEINIRTKRKIKCFVQVNVSGEESKHGISPSETSSFIQQLKEFDNIVVVGLMTMAPFTNDERVLRQCFKTMKLLQEQVQELGLEHAPCNELSMGMSNDYSIAIEEGATFIRIGTALVGN